MRVDDILSALAIMRQRLMCIDGAYTADQAQHRLLKISCMRDYCLEEDPVGFSSYCQRSLATDPDTTSSLLDELWEELGLGCEAALWDDFEVQYL